MIENTPPRERVVLVAAPRKGSLDAQKITEHLDELARLVDTAGAEIVGTLTQPVPASPEPPKEIENQPAAEDQQAGEGQTAAPVTLNPDLAKDFLALGFCYFQVELLTRHLRHFSNLA